MTHFLRDSRTYLAAAVLALASYAGFNIYNNYKSRLSESPESRIEAPAKPSIERLTYDQLVKREPRFNNIPKDSFFLSDILKAREFRDIHHVDLDGDGKKDFFLYFNMEKTSPYNPQYILDGRFMIVKSDDSGLKLAYGKGFGLKSPEDVKAFLRDIDNDNLPEIFRDLREPGFNLLEMIKLVRDEHLDSDIIYDTNYRFEDIDSDGIDEILSVDENASGRDLGREFVFRLDDWVYKISSQIVYADGSIIDSSSSRTREHSSRLTQDSPSLEGIVQEGYPQPNYPDSISDNYPVLRRINLNLMLKDSVNTLSAQQTSLANDPIVGATVYMAVVNSRTNESLPIPQDTFTSDRRGLVKIYHSFYLAKSDNLDICFNIEHYPYDPKTNECITLDDIDPQIVSKGGSTHLSTPHLMRGDRIRGFEVEKGKNEQGIGSLEELTLSLTMSMPLERRYPN